MKNELILTVGISGSGKTTFASTLNKNVWENLNRDSIRFSLFTNNIRDFTKYKFNNKNEKRVSSIIDQLAYDAVVENKSIIVSDTNLSTKTRNKWKAFAEKYGYKYSEKAFPIEWEEARKRNQQREGGISESVLWTQYLRMNEYLGRRTYQGTPNKPNAVIVDIDGTVACMKGIRKPFEWDKVGEDKPRLFVINMLEGLMDQGITPVFLSGRDGCCQKDTYDWIYRNIMDTDFHLFMRELNDSRKDKIVKEEIFWKYVANNFNVVGAIDDRSSVLQLWRELGINNIIDVSGDRYYEF